MRHGSTPTRSTARLAILAALAILPATVAAQGPAPFAGADQAIVLPDSLLGRRMAPLLLLSRADIKADLGFSEAKAEAAREAIISIRSRAAALVGRREPGMRDARGLVDEAAQAWIEAELTADQKARLAQLDLQWEGPSSLVSRPPVSQALNLSADQVAAIRTAIADRDAKRARGDDPRAAERTLATACLALLDEGQQAQWNALLGPPFAVRFAAQPAPSATPRR